MIMCVEDIPQIMIAYSVQEKRDWDPYVIFQITSSCISILCYMFYAVKLNL